MTDTRVFQIDTEKGNVYEMHNSSMALEKELQTLMENNLNALLGINFLETEYSTGKKHKGRIDTLGIDENGCPVIIEYKRSINENVINQGLFYLDWLMDHKAEFELLVLKRLGKETADNIEWTNPRLICIAGDFTRYDQHAVQQMNRNIELVRYRYYDESILLLELVNAIEVQNDKSNNNDHQKNTKGKISTSKTFTEYLEQCDSQTQTLYDNLKVFIESLGDDIQIKILKHYIAFKKLKNFACVEVHPQTKSILVYLKIYPDPAIIESGFTRDVRNIGHFGTGDLEIRIQSQADLEKAEQLIQKSYDIN